MLTCDVDLVDYHALVGRTLDTLEHGTEYAVEAAAVEGVAEAKRVGPFTDRTGHLRGNIVAHFVSSSGRSVIWEMLSPMYYSKFVDQGTSRARAFPFMGPGYLQAERTLYREMGLTMRRIEQLWR